MTTRYGSRLPLFERTFPFESENWVHRHSVSVDVAWWESGRTVHYSNVQFHFDKITENWPPNKFEIIRYHFQVDGRRKYQYSGDKSTSGELWFANWKRAPMAPPFSTDCQWRPLYKNTRRVWGIEKVPLTAALLLKTLPINLEAGPVIISAYSTG